MKKINFVKMQGAGNDYIYVDCLKGLDFEPSALAIKMSPRHLSVGSDGLVLICASTVADAKMRMFNADGSEGMMCGNAIRCVGKYLYDTGVCAKSTITVETLSGIKTLTPQVVDSKVQSVSVDMGKATFAPADVPVLADGEMVGARVEVGGTQYGVTALSVGNPHAVVFVKDVAGFEVQKIGSQFENMPLFPQRVNTEFVQVNARDDLTMRVWERGSGETFACGTGACASVAAAIKNGYCDFNKKVCVHLLGGDLTITVSPTWQVTMQGPAVKVYEGVYEYED